MNVSSPAYSGIQDASQRLADIGQRAAELSTASEPELSVMPQSPSQKATTRQPPEVPVETYNASGQVNQGRKADFEEMMVERVQAQNQLEANVDVAKSTNQLVGRLIDQTV
jgi:hypothetical protein|tara:strand:- start:137 stop:469 length:333 start_codon:yes stop_codon:yes gene_type:complete